MLPIQHNMMAWNAERQFNIVTKAKQKKTERLSSGYRINRAADDAAGLAISEKMRRYIRGLKAGTENAQSGVSWVQIGEGALNEAHDILHRMNELSIKAQNGTNTDADRAFMEAEFEQLQSELDRISSTTTFNELNIFRDHEPTYDQICGNKIWDYEEIHTIERGKNKLVINYRDTPDSEQKTVTLTVPPGSYTTHELIDELDNSAGISGPIHMEFTDKGNCRVNLEGGQIIDDITGDLTYLLWDCYDGGGYGALIGTTEHADGNPLEIFAGKNDHMEFWIEYFDTGNTEKIQLDLAAGKYTKEEIMKQINDQVLLTYPKSGLKAVDHGDSIKLYSDIGIVTGFKGNMFDIDGAKYTSVFYDNIQKGFVWHDPAFVAGGAVLTTDTRDEEHNRYYIDSTNNKLVLQPNGMETATTIEITVKPKNADDPTQEGYTAEQMAKELNDQFAAKGIDGEVKAYVVKQGNRKAFHANSTENADYTTNFVTSLGDTNMLFEGIEIRTVKEGPDAIVRINKAESTAYDTLFTTKNYNYYGGSSAVGAVQSNATDAVVNNETVKDRDAYAQSSKTYGSGDKITFNSKNNRFNITLRSTKDRGSNSAQDFSVTHTINVGTGEKTAEAIKNAINASIATYADFKDRIEAVVTSDGRIRIEDKDYTDTNDKTLANPTDPYLNWNTTIELSSYGSNTGLRTIFEKSYTYDVQYTKSGKGSLTLTYPGSTGVKDDGMTININGSPVYFDFNGKTGLSQITSEMNAKEKIKFSAQSSQGSTNAKSVTMSNTGREEISYWAGGTAEGESKRIEGTTRFEKNSPASLSIGPVLPTTMTVDSSNNKITLNLNGVKKTLTIANGTYSRGGLADALQDAIDDETNGFGTGAGGASVTIDSENRLLITSNLPRGTDGADTSITAYARGAATNTFFDSLNRVETAARATSNQIVSNNITLQAGVDDQFRFSYTDSTGSHTVTINLGDASGISRSTLLGRIQTGLSNPANNDDGSAIGVMADLDAYGHLVLTTKEKGAGTSISYSAGSSDANANEIFGLTNPTAAQIVLDKNVQAKSGSGGTFKFILDNQQQEVTIGGWDNSTANTLAKRLNDQFNSKGLDVQADLVGGKLRLTKKTAGSGNISMNYDSGGTSMEKIFGYEPSPGVKITGANNQLTITAGANDVISVYSGSSGGFLKPKSATGYYTAVESGGFHSAKFSTVTSTRLNAGGVELTKWNNQLKFKFSEDGGTTWKDVDFRLAESAPGTKTSLSDIKTQLQTKIDAALGADKIEVLLDTTTNQLSLKSGKAGEQYRFGGLQSDAGGKTGGGFFHHVMCAYTERTGKLSDRKDVNGEQWADDIYAQGRHDVVTELTKIKPGVSDTLILDLTYIPDQNHDNSIENDKKQTITLEVKLDANMKEEDFYDGDRLKKMIQDRLNDTIKSQKVQEDAAKLGIKLHENLIEVDINRHDTHIWGNKDKVSLSFTMTKDHEIATPEEGYFYIDGIRGNAAYETFYHTEGELIPAYVIGTKDISKGVTLTGNDRELSFVVDDKEYTVRLDAGSYTAEEIVDTITDKFKEQNIPLAAEVTKKGFLKISHERMGRHVIEKVSGSARNELFYTEHAGKTAWQDPFIRISSFDGDRIELYSPRFSTTMLHINSICISRIKNAEKATNRLKEAITTVSSMRGTFGAIQNRLEHTINNNNNKEENLQAAESRIRDADVAKEMLEYSNLSIIQQAGQAVLAQAHHSRDGILQLLQ